MSLTSRRTADGDELSLPIEMEARPRSRGVVPPPALTADMPPTPMSATPLITDGSSGLLAAASHTQTPGESPLPGLLSPTGLAFPQLPTLAAESLNPERNGAPPQPTAPQSRHEEQASEEWTDDLNRRESPGDAGDRGRAAEAAPQPQRWQRGSGALSASSRPYGGPPETSNRAPRARSAGVSPSSSPMITGAAEAVGHPPSTFPPGSSSSSTGSGGGGGAAPPAARSTSPRPGAYLETVDSPMPTQGEAPFLGSVSTISDFASSTNAAARSMLSAPDIPNPSTTLAALPGTPKASARWQRTSVPQKGVTVPPLLVSFPEQRASAVSVEQPVYDGVGQRTLSMTDTTTSSSSPAAGAGTSSVIMVASLSPQQLSPAPSSHRQQQRFQEERRTSRSTTVSQSDNAVPGTAPALAASTPRAMDHIVVDNAEFAILRVLPQQRSHSTSRGASRTEDAANTARSPSRHAVTAVLNNNSSTTNNASTSRTQREVSRNAESADEIGWRGVADFASLASGLPPVTGDSMGGLALLQQARIATAEERRVRLLFHNRPHVQLEKRPLVVTNAVLDRISWEQPLCYLPLFFPCMRNAFYSVPLSTVMRTSWEADLPGPSQPSVAYSESATSQSPVNAPAVPPRRDGNYAEVPRTLMTPTVSISTVYHVPITAPRPVLNRAASPHRRERQESLLHRPAAAPPPPPTTGPNPLSRAPARPLLNREDELVMLRDEVARQPLSLGNNVSHLLYRCFCVRCAIASQAQAMQADADMRAAHPTPFPCCTCLGVETKSYSDILCLLCVLDVLTLGVPCGCCCYHGLGSALYGWHLRYLLRARYRIFAWTSIDLLTTCCVPGLAVDQQGAELLLSGTPEATIGLQFMA